MTVSEHLSHAEGFRLVKAMSWGTSLLAMLVGVLGVMNTMLMTVFERTHEICVLLAVGWKRGRIMRMILYESALLGFFGGVVGVAIGAIGVKVLSETPAIRGLLQPDLSIPLTRAFRRHRGCSWNYQRSLSCLAQLAFNAEPGVASRMRAAQTASETRHLHS